MDLFHALILGLVEGITEFLPISSTGHLILTAEALGLSGDAVDSFIDAIQCGAILAVIAAYPRRFKALFDFKGSGFSGTTAWTGLIAATLPAALLALAFEKQIKGLLFGPLPVAAALALGAGLILWLDPKNDAEKGSDLDSLKPGQALKIGLWQCLALWPGMSRSACSILGGLNSGLKHSAAVEFSFFAAMPLLFAAAAYEIIRHPERLAGIALPFAVGLVTAFASAFVAVKLFAAYVSKAGLRPFAWYRLGLAALVIAFYR